MFARLFQRQREHTPQTNKFEWKLVKHQLTYLTLTFRLSVTSKRYYIIGWYSLHHRLQMFLQTAKTCEQRWCHRKENNN